jgi:hypothetical protein
MITADLQASIGKLKASGWQAEMHADGKRFPDHILQRYDWVPTGWLEFLSQVSNIVNPEETVWVLSPSDYRHDTDAAFPADAWERLSLECAAQENDNAWAAKIRAFWDEHFPVALSVGSGYAYYALRKSDHQVVHGMEPEFEGTSVFAGSLGELLAKLPEVR